VPWAGDSPGARVLDFFNGNPTPAVSRRGDGSSASACAGLDVHKDSVVACVRHMVDGDVKREVRSFKTTTKGLLALSEWLSVEGCTHIVMESTGVYWKPVWHIVSDGEF